MNLKDLKQIKLQGGNRKIMKIKNEKGITLIALVVTIVVLLILAGVSVNAIFNDNGIIKRAQEAQNKMDEAQQNDLTALNELNNWLDNSVKGNTSGDTEVTELKKQITNDETIQVDKSTDYTNEAGLEINCKNYVGTIDECTASNIKKLEIRSGSTTQDITFNNCDEVIIYSDAILQRVVFENVKKMTVYSGAAINQCTFKQVVNTKVMNSTINDCVFASGNIMFKDCEMSQNANNGATIKYNNCTVDGEPSSN